MIEIGPQGARALIPILRDQRADVRRRTAEILGKIKDAQAVEALIAALQDKDENVRSKAAWALGEIKDLRGVEPLIAVLKDTDINVRIKATQSLGWLKDVKAVKPLIEVLKRDSDLTSNELKDTTIRALVQIGTQAAGPLIEALKDKSYDVRRGAALLERGRVDRKSIDYSK